MQTNTVIIHQQDRIHFLSPKQIVYCKSDNCYTTLYLQEGETILVVKSLTKFHKDLPSSSFVRVHQSYLINKNFIRSINKKNKSIILEADHHIPYTVPLRDLLELIHSDFKIDEIADHSQ